MGGLGFGTPAWLEQPVRPCLCVQGLRKHLKADFTYGKHVTPSVIQVCAKDNQQSTTSLRSGTLIPDMLGKSHGEQHYLKNMQH